MVGKNNGSLGSLPRRQGGEECQRCHIQKKELILSGLTNNIKATRMVLWLHPYFEIFWNLWFNEYTYSYSQILNYRVMTPIRVSITKSPSLEGRGSLTYNVYWLFQ